MSHVFRHKFVYLAALLILAGSAVWMILNRPGQQIAHGFVEDGANPAVGAVVRLRGDPNYVLTDEEGRFQLPIDPGETDAQLTAWSPGHYVGGSDVADFLDADGAWLQLKSHPTDDNPDYEFISPVLDLDNSSACGNCHLQRTGESDGLLPVDEWLLDAHSGAAANPRFLSLYNGTTLNGLPGQLTTYQFDPAQGVNVPVAPSMGEDGVGAGYRLDFPDQAGSCANCHAPVLALDQPYHADPNEAAGVAAEGITCDFCHKVQDVRLTANGRPDPGLPGVLSMEFLRPAEDEQVFIGPLDDTPGDDIYSPLQNQSQYCAACHTGQFWDVPIYNSFGEWLDSPYSDPDTGRTCQDCHMPPTGATVFASLPPDNPLVLPTRDPSTIFSHRMPGAADQTLLENTASLEVEIHRIESRLEVIVRLTNTGAGHHIPTDNPLRNIILLVQPVDQDGQPLPLVNGSVIPSWGGEGEPSEGFYAGLPGVLYAKVLTDFYTGETPSFAYWRQTRLVSDNRIPALATDESTYQFAAPTGSITLDVRLYLRRAFIDLMELKGWDTPDILMEQQTVSIP